MTQQHIILVDASGFAYRSFATQSAGYRESDGEPVGAVLGFIQMIWRLLGAAEADKPTHGCAVFDYPGKNFRHKLYPKYKSNRPAARAVELDKQLAIMRSAADVLGLTPIEKKGFEADDLIASLADWAHRIGVRTTIISSDKDFSQMVEDGSIEIIDPMSKQRVLSAQVYRKFGVEPYQVPYVQALAGDTADGIPGIPGLGIERAAAMVRRFGTLKGVLANADKCRWPYARTQLKRKAADARLYLKLTTLRRNVPLNVSFDDLVMKPVMRSHVEEIAKALGATARVNAIFSLDAQTVRVVPHVRDPFGWWSEELKAPGQRLPDLPQCGFYQRRLVAKGALVPARIWRAPEVDVETGKPTGRDLLKCEVGGKPRDPNAEWARLAMNPIKESLYHYEMADSEHAKRYRPGDPKATPHIAPDLLKAKAPHNPKPVKKRKRA